MRIYLLIIFVVVGVNNFLLTHLAKGNAKMVLYRLNSLGRKWAHFKCTTEFYRIIKGFFFNLIVIYLLTHHINDNE